MKTGANILAPHDISTTRNVCSACVHENTNNHITGWSQATRALNRFLHDGTETAAAMWLTVPIIRDWAKHMPCMSTNHYTWLRQSNASICNLDFKDLFISITPCANPALFRIQGSREIGNTKRLSCVLQHTFPATLSGLYRISFGNSCNKRHSKEYTPTSTCGHGPLNCSTSNELEVRTDYCP
ncbi:hypothetical protein ASPWEDRAFT_269575 [Aspergillus wentii DTO 134E9]|uniref:Uncharacterized protein n=1 Tax=Aspergillus wentii DTO 134E9 TaxID=1073089 RepID=A0A1L9S2U5_ASPWE|nr:uncharacterized protein ASPWEDRAFT_269575 [Aspergillus wentii DTO 134E9]OJJ41485.1 hypothetical protein ASPWEDRAFT_269575 [Aspergillus wentii DTO 134E9]